MRDILSTRQANLFLATFSPDEKWILFTAEGPAAPRVFVAPFRGAQAVPETDWVELGPGDYPVWSNNGNYVYFVAGDLKTIQAQQLDSIRKTAVGAPRVVYRFEMEWSLQGLAPGGFRMAVARDKLVFPLGRRQAGVELLR